jgi:hypothetical protein
VCCGAFVGRAAATPAPDNDSGPDAADVAELLREQTDDARRATALTRTAIDAIGRRDWPAAETALIQSLEIVPDNPLNLYNLACVKSQLGKGDAAVEALERAAAAGFGDFALALRDPDLAPLRGLPRFKAFIENKDEWQRRAAERVLGGLRTRFGDGYAYEVDAEHKLIFATNVSADVLAELKGSLAAQARGQARDLFSNKPEAYVSVVVPSAADYRKIMRFRNVGGVYFNATKTLVAQRPGDVMRHEFTHALHAADRAPLGQEHAPWVVEGLGVLYESTTMETGGGGPGDGGNGAPVLVPLPDNARLPAAQAAARRKSLVPLARLVEMSHSEFLKRPNLTYTQAGALMLYLRDRGWLRNFYDLYKQTYDVDPTGRTALERASGMTLAKFEAAWVKWLTDRAQAPFFGAPALFLGARVAPGEGGLTIVSVAANGPAAEAGLQPRDVVLAINGKPVPDYAALRPALGAYTPGKVIALRIRRAGKESDVSVKLANLTSAPRTLQER